MAQPYSGHVEVRHELPLHEHRLLGVVTDVASAIGGVVRQSVQRLAGGARDAGRSDAQSQIRVAAYSGPPHPFEATIPTSVKRHPEARTSGHDRYTANSA